MNCVSAVFSIAQLFYAAFRFSKGHCPKQTSLGIFFSFLKSCP